MMLASRSRRLALPFLFAALAVVSTGARAFARNDDVDVVVGGVVLLAIVLAIYVIPMLVAFVRDHPDRWAILVANVLLGFTGVGWVGCLVWSLIAVHRPVADHRGRGDAFGLAGSPGRQPYAPIGALADQHLEKLSRLKTLVDEGAITQEEYGYLKLTLLRSAATGR